MTREPPDDESLQAAIKAIGDRFRQFLDLQHRGSQLAWAKQLGISQPAISRVAAGEQLPSGKLILVLTQHTNLNLDWLLTGRGDKFLVEGSGSLLVPVADQPLPGPPSEHSNLFNGALAGCGITPTPHQYWLRVQRHDPITEAEGQKIQPGDLIRLDTDRSRFPKPSEINEELWLVRISVKGQPVYRLAEVSYTEGGWLEADTFDLAPPTEKMEEEIVLRRLPGKKFQVSITYREPERAKGTRRLEPRKAPVLPGWPHGIKEEDLVARKIAILRR